MVTVDDSPRIIGNIGGQPKQIYWTPDGRQIRAMPDIHEYALRDNKGVVISNGVRDANLDKGWLLQKPVELKPYCHQCDGWHDTKEEIRACELKYARLVAKHEEKAKKELGIDRIGKLEADMGELKNLMKQLLERRNG